MALAGNPLSRIYPRINRAAVPVEVEDVPGQIIPVHHIPPSPREMRAQAIYRLQVGLMGLAGMLLLVGLANIIMDRAQLTEKASAGTEAASAAGGTAPVIKPNPAGASDPLVDMGVAPELPVADSSEGPGATPVPAAPKQAIPSPAPLRNQDGG